MKSKKTDYRKVNAICKTDAEPLPRIDSLLDKLNSVKCFSTLDLTSGYWRIPLHDKDKEKEKLAFITTEELECLAIVDALDNFYYLHGKEFIIHTDHAALVWLNNVKILRGRLFRWSLRLSMFHIDGRSPVPKDCNCNFYICPALVVYNRRNLVNASLLPHRKGQLTEYNDIARILIGRFEKAVPLSTRLQLFSSCIQGPSESVQEFAGRINKLVTQICQSGNSAQNTAVRNANDQLLQSRFISGLRNEIRRFVLSRDPSNLDESINAALIEEQNMKLNQIASEERSGLLSAQTENPVLSALADRLEELNLRVGRLQEASSVTARKSGGIILTEGRTFSNAFIVEFRDIDRRIVEKGGGTRTLPIISPPEKRR
ncbi:transposon Tf2-9 polyprotein [Trichonephila clavipes]|nr:transposon Tf2-9 polyprotein [Trichonephila clavipes]